MKYLYTRDDIRSGDLIALSHNRWASWSDVQVMAIRVFRMTEYSHVGVAWRICGRLFILHAIGGGVSITPLSLNLPFYWLPLDQWTPEAEEYALSTVGQRYSKWQAILAGLGMLRGGTDDRWECAEWANMVLRRCGHDVGDAYTPDELVDRLLILGHQLYAIHQ